MDLINNIPIIYILFILILFGNILYGYDVFLWSTFLSNEKNTHTIFKKARLLRAKFRELMCFSFLFSCIINDL